MKNFFTSFFATLSALVVFCLGGVLVMVLLLAAIAAMGEKTVDVPKGSYLVLDLSGNIADTPEQMEGLDEFAEAFGGSRHKVMQLRAVTRAIQAAASDTDIAGLYIRGEVSPEGYGSGFAALKEVREAIAAFKASGKPVKAYLGFTGTRTYYVASVAGELNLDPYGAIAMPGLASKPMFFTGVFEKLGIGVQITRVGKYKSAIEPFVRRDMSPENRTQTQKLLDDIWGELVTNIEQARQLKPGALQAAVDNDGVIRPEAALKLKLVDRIAYHDEVLEDLKAATGRAGTKKPYKQIAVREYARLVSGDGLVARREAGDISGSSGKVAIVYAEGDIVDGDGKDRGYVWGSKLAREIRGLRQDDSVKAIVLRVNSPGGSASASETIQRELRLTMKTKPVIVSMGTVAASGGYWISTYSNRIFAEPSTITGSIGVFGMFLNVQGLATEKMGLTFDTVMTAKFADLMTITRPKTDEELAIFQKLVDWIYEEFVSKVAESRKLDKATVHQIAQGRVWSGAEAQKLGLVDELGGLDAAVKYAAGKANLGDKFRIVEVPRKKQFAEAISEAFEGHRQDNSTHSQLDSLVREVLVQIRTLEHLNDPRSLYARLPFDLRVE